MLERASLRNAGSESEASAAPPHQSLRGTWTHCTVAHGGQGQTYASTFSHNYYINLCRKMLPWVQVTLMLCAVGLLREIRPSEPFVSEFLLGEWRNITEEQLNRDVYPVGTYCYLGLLVVVFLITDFLRFKPVIVLSGEFTFLLQLCIAWVCLDVNDLHYQLFFTYVKLLQASQMYKSQFL